MALPFSRNKLKETIDGGRVALGVGVLWSSPSTVELVGRLGVDFVWLDLEHTGPSPYDSPSIENFARAADVGGTSLLVRVPANDEWMIGKVLDTGVHALLVPSIRSREGAEQIVQAARYGIASKRGERGATLSRATSWHASSEDFLKNSDSNVLVGAMLETREAIDRIEDIVSVEGLDFFFLGHADLSLSLNVPFQYNHPLLQEYTRKALSACKELGKPLGTVMVTPDSESILKAIDQGFNMVRIGTDVNLLVSEVERLLKGLGH